jgi:hypothetical protein
MALVAFLGKHGQWVQVVHVFWVHGHENSRRGKLLKKINTRAGKATQSSPLLHHTYHPCSSTWLWWPSREAWAMGAGGACFLGTRP